MMDKVLGINTLFKRKEKESEAIILALWNYKTILRILTFQFRPSIKPKKKKNNSAAKTKQYILFKEIMALSFENPKRSINTQKNKAIPITGRGGL
jgi:hypothetical protein